MSEVKVNKISPRTNCGTTTLGDSGDSFVIPSGVTITNNGTQSGFGRTGTVDWQTGSIKTATFTATSGEGYFCNTTAGSFEVDLPAGSAGAIVSVQDYNNTFDSNSLTVDPNGSEKINGGTAGAAVTLNVEGQGVTFVYIDATVGWRTVAGSDDPFAQSMSNYIQATGGTIVTCGDFKTHIFTGPGTFNVTGAGNACGSNTVDYFVVAGGGSGAAYGSFNQGLGGGGAGGFRLSNSYSLPAPTTSPLANPTGLTVPVQGYPVTVGAGGDASNLPGPCNSQTGAAGSNSIFSTITSAGGGFDNVAVSGAAIAGGSGGGGGRGNGSTQTGGAGNTPPVSPSQGNPGGGGTPMPAQGSPAPNPSRNGGGGGGAGATGGSAGVGNSGGGAVGSFIAPGFVGPTAPSYGSPGPVSARYFAGGGGGSGGSGGQPGGSGGGGNGTQSANGDAGDANTGGGGGGSNNTPYPGNGGAGGSGIVMIRYKFQ